MISWYKIKLITLVESLNGAAVDLTSCSNIAVFLDIIFPLKF